MRWLFTIAPLALSLVWVVPAAHAQSTSPGAAQQKPAADPNERVCEDVVETGSRLATKRFCGTRSQWEDKKRQDREAVEKAQLSPCVMTHNGSGGRPGC